MARKLFNLRLIGNTNYQIYTLLLFLSLILMTGLLVLGVILLVLIKSNQFIHLSNELQLKIFHDLTFAALITLIACAAIGSLLIIRYTNTVAGPLYRLKLYLHNMLDGNIQPPLHFRADDNFKDLTIAVNSFQEKLESLETSSRN